MQGMINHIASASVDTLVKEVWADKYGTGEVRRIALGERYDEVMAAINKPKAKMRVGAKVKYSGYVYADSYGNGRGQYVTGTFIVKYYNSNPYGAHLVI